MITLRDHVKNSALHIIFMKIVHDQLTIHFSNPNTPSYSPNMFG